MSVSVLIPSRGRPASLRHAVTSYRTLADGPVEILVAVDEDDTGTIAVAREIADQVHVSARHGYADLHRYYNALAELASTPWVWLGNDDAHVTTPGFDTLIGKWDGHDVILDCDNNHSRNWVLFPIVPTRFVHAVGHFSLMPSCDSWWQDIGRHLGLIREAGIFMHHDRPDVTGSSVHDDATWREGRSGLRLGEYFGPQMAALRQKDADIVADLIGLPA